MTTFVPVKVAALRRGDMVWQPLPERAFADALHKRTSPDPSAVDVSSLLVVLVEARPGSPIAGMGAEVFFYLAKADGATVSLRMPLNKTVMLVVPDASSAASVRARVAADIRRVARDMPERPRKIGAAVGTDHANDFEWAAMIAEGTYRGGAR